MKKIKDEPYREYPTSPSEWMLIGLAMMKIQFWSTMYDFSFQFWGPDNNNVYIARDLTDIRDMGGEDTPLDILNRTIKWCERANPSVRYPEGFQINNPQP